MKAIYNILEDSAENYGNKVAVYCEGEEVTYKDLYQKAIGLTEKLESCKLKKDDIVLIIMNNSIEFIESFFAVNILNAVIVPVSIDIGKEKLNQIIDYFDADLIITIKKLESNINSLLFNNHKKLKSIIYLDLNEVFCLDNPSFHCELTNNIKNKKQLKYNVDTAIIFLSSGTTNIPKGIMLSNGNIITNVKSISTYLKLDYNDKVLLVKNINHASSITGEMLVSLYNGCTLYLTRKIPTSSLIAKTIRDNKITIFFTIPTLLVNILDNTQIKADYLKKLKKINYYGSTISIPKIEQFIEKYPWINLIYSYGLTEAAPRVTYINKIDWLNKKKSSGKPIEDVSVFIVDKDKKRVGCNIIGEIVVKGPNVMLGYYKNHELTNKVLRENMLYTGDLGYIDDEGYLYVTGRRDNLIVIAGKNIYPEEIEGIFLQIPGIKEVLVNEKYDELLENKIEAHIVAEDNFNMSRNEIYRILRKNLESYKIPHRIYFTENLEKTISGKIVRRK